MAKNRKYQSAAVRFGPALKAVLLCTLIGGAGVGYVWQKSQIIELGQQIAKSEKCRTQLRDQNKKLHDQLAMLQSPGKLEQRVREFNLGLGPPSPAQVWRVVEPEGLPALPRVATGQYAAGRTEKNLMP